MYHINNVTICFAAQLVQAPRILIKMPHKKKEDGNNNGKLRAKTLSIKIKKMFFFFKFAHMLHICDTQLTNKINRPEICDTTLNIINIT